MSLDRVQTLWQLFLQGGILMWPIVAMSLVVLTFGIERFVALRRGRFVPAELRDGIAKLVAGGFDPRKAYRLCREFPSAAADVLEAMLEKVGRPVPEIERAAELAKDREASRLYANIRPISLAVTVTPLLGLLGTVQGMIIAFYTTANLEAGANRAAELASGIYVALITTFAGLCVAIPAAMLAHWLEGRILRGFRGVDDLVGEVLPQLERYENKGRLTAAQLAAQPPEVPKR
ncbi:MAG: MotA/TolQ/ExbB proton channel family protein [Planctomycetia bacterium]